MLIRIHFLDQADYQNSGGCKVDDSSNRPVVINW
jgi:hypothetical protein